MKSTVGQKYIPSFFFGGLAADIDSELLDTKTGTVLEAQYMHVYNQAKNILQKIGGSSSFIADVDLGAAATLIGLIWLRGYIVEFWYLGGATHIYANGLLIANNVDLPGNATHYLDIDKNHDTWELFITDNNQCPVILNLEDMLDEYATTKYFADYNRKLYEINKPVELNQPAFQCLEVLGAGGGLKAGSYAYSMRYASINGDKSDWSPASPYIPVPYNTRPPIGTDAQRAHSGILIAGQAASLTPTKFGIRIRIRITNTVGFDYIELRRYANNTGQPLNFTAISEYIILSLDAGGAVIDIKANPYSVVDFIDSDSQAWAILDESVSNTYSTIKKARTIRYFNKRIILGGVEYESKELPTEDIFIVNPTANKIAFPILKQFSYDNYSNMLNQVYYKSHRCGERYGFAAKLYDNQGNMLFAIPLVKDTESFMDYQFPERRTPIPSAEQSFSPDAQTISTIKSWNVTDEGRTDKVYEPIKSLLVQKDTNSRIHNIVGKEVEGTTYIYRPCTPTGRDDGYVGGGGVDGDGGGGVDFTGLGTEYMLQAEGGSYNKPRHGTRKSAVGLCIGGINPATLPSWVKGFSIVRTPAAGRVVCQGIAMYALTPQAPGSTNPSLVKSLTKVWFYSPEFDINIGDKQYLFDDIKANPSEYKLQLVSPVGFFTDVYSAYEFALYTTKIDMISYAIMGGNNIQDMEPTGFDTAAQIGISGDAAGRCTFGRFRNVHPTYNQGSGLVDDALTFTISSAIEPSLTSYYNVATSQRTPYLELSLASNIYAYTNLNWVVGTDGNARSFHEPWYVVNIIQDGKHVPNNNINSYKDIGHYVKFTSIIGIGTGIADQTFELVDERQADVYTLGTGTTNYRYIWVNDKPWLGANNIPAGDLTTYKTALESVGYFTPSGGLTCYGLYFYYYTLTSTGPFKKISFPYKTIPSENPICPASGDKIEVKYNNNSPIEIFLGDTIVDDALFAPIDCNILFPPDVNQLTNPSGVNLHGAMPYRDFYMQLLNYYQPRDPENETDFNGVFEPPENQHQIEYVRQWIVSFGCESTVNLPFMYKNYFPNRNYVLRPAVYNTRLSIETTEEYYDDIGLWTTKYNTDYPEEWQMWGYGGFYLPNGTNLDYEKSLHTRSFTKPASGTYEILNFAKRFHWSIQSLAGYPSSRAFIPMNVYDLKNDKASQISILYDCLSTKGNNLYVITDYGAGMALTDKKMITDAIGNALTIAASESTLIQGEVWLNANVGCPKEFWRGKTEGNVKLQNNILAPLLVFPTHKDIIVLTNDQFLAIEDNNRKAIQIQLNSIDINSDFSGLLSSVINETDNDLIIRIGTRSFYFNFDINNWGGSIIHRDQSADKELIKSIFVPWLIGNTSRSVLANVSYNPTNHHRDIALMDGTATLINPSLYKPYVVFSVTPIVGDVHDFIDMYISATHKPYSVVVAMDQAFTDPSTITATKITTLNDGWYYIHGFPKTVGNKKLIGKTLYVKITFPDNNYFYGLKLTKTGYKGIAGG